MWLMAEIRLLRLAIRIWQFRRSDSRYRDEAERLTSQGFKALDAYEQAGDPEFLDVAVATLRHAVAVTPPDHPDHADRLANLADALFARFERAGTEADVDDAIAVTGRAVDLIPPGHPGRAVLLSNLGAVLLSRFELAGMAIDLDTAVQVGEQAVALSSPDDPGRAGRLSNLANALRFRFALTGDISDLDAAIEVHRQSLTLISPNQPDLAACLSNLAITLTARFERTGNGTDLNAAIEAVGRATRLTPPGHRDRAGYLSSLGHALRERFKLMGDVADLNAAVDAGQQSVGITAHGSVDRAWYLSDTGASLLVRFELNGDESDLGAAVDASRLAVNLTVPGHPNRPGYLSNLGNTLRARFELKGDIADLNAAIEAGREAVDLTPDAHVNLGLFLSNLASALWLRAQHTENVADPGAAVDACARALDLTPPGHPSRPCYLSNLGNALRARFWITMDTADLDAAVEAGQQAIDLTPDDHSDLLLDSLAQALIDRFGHTQNTVDLNAAVEAGQRSVTLTLPGHPSLARKLSNLAVSLRARYEQAGDAGDLDTAIDHWRQAAALTSPGHPNLAVYLSNRADALNARYRRTGNDRDLDTALDCWQRACTAPVGIPGIRLAAAQNLGVSAAEAGRTREGAEGFAQAVALLPEVAWQGVDRASRERQLAHWHGLAANAAACALDDNRTDLAVELLEQGRSVLWSQALALRSDLSRLVSASPQLAERLSAIRASLDAPLSGSSPLLTGIQWNEHGRPGDDRQMTRAIDRRIALAREWDDLVQRVQKLKGFEDFLRTPRLERMLPAAEGGPVVIVNVSPWRCDALIVTTTGVKVENLAGLTSKVVTIQARRYLNGLVQMERAAHASSRSRPGTDRPELSLHTARARYERILGEVTAWLWDEIAGPVLAALDITDLPGPGEPWPRLWWCPTGALNLLPLHAAGHHTAEGRVRHQSVLDRVVSSYTPTVRALLEAREEADPESPAEVITASADRSGTRMLVVGVASTPDQMPLPNVARELRMLSALLPDCHTILSGPAATCDAVRAQLPSHRWVHFSCHADQDFADPSRGGVQLHDRQLTIEDIGDGRYRGDFAFLSACKTAAGGSFLSDEAITVAAALHYTGYRHVIAAQWIIRDKTAADVAESIYRHMISAGTFEPSRAAHALHTTIRGLREARKPLSQWMQFIHTGP
jgi:tetratricopeptide (TPR) repeat protein